MRTDTEVREKLWELLEYNKTELLKQRESSFPQMYNDSIANRGGIIDGLCWALGYKGFMEFIELEVKAGRASLGADLDAQIRKEVVSTS